MKKLFFIIIITGLIVNICSAVQKYWVGTGSGTGKQWNQANNWNPTGVPQNGDDVIINNGKDCNINVNTNTLNSLTLGSGKLTFGDNMTLYIGGSFTITGGTFTPGNGIVAYVGSSQQTIYPTTYSNLIINNTAGVTLGGNTTINGALTITNGRINTAAYSLTRNNLSGTGIKYLLSQNNYIDIVEAGISSITITEFADTDPPNLPLEYDATKGVKRYYEISNVTGSSGSANLRLDYFASEMGENFTPTDGNVWQYRDPGPWVNQSGFGEMYYVTTLVPIASENLAGYYAIASDDSKMPIQLLYFNGYFVEGNDVVLEWSTASELKNYGFNVQRLNEGTQAYENIGFVNGSGTTLGIKIYSFLDENVKGVPTYRLEQIDEDGLVNYFGPISLNPNSTPDIEVPVNFKLYQNYPNPFNSMTTISFSLENPGYTTLKVYNILGLKVATLFSGYAEAAKIYRVNFDAQNLPSGHYIYKLESGNNSKICRMTLLK